MRPHQDLFLAVSVFWCGVVKGSGEVIGDLPFIFNSTNLPRNACIHKIPAQPPVFNTRINYEMAPTRSGMYVDEAVLDGLWRGEVQVAGAIFAHLLFRFPGELREALFAFGRLGFLVDWFGVLGLGIED